MSETIEINGCKCISPDNELRNNNSSEITILNKLNELEQKIDEVLRLCQK